MAVAFTVSFNASEIHTYFDVIKLGLADTMRMHELMCIQVQGWIFRKWRKLKPPLHPLTLETRQHGGDVPLWDAGTLIGSVTGGTTQADTLKVSPKEGSLNLYSKEFGQVGTRLPYAITVILGGWIESKGGRDGSAHNLAIPLDKEAASYDSPLDYDKELDFIPARGGKPGGVLADPPLSKGGESVARWWLTPKVWIDQRNPFPSTYEINPILFKVGNWYLGKLAAAQSPKTGLPPPSTD